MFIKHLIYRIFVATLIFIFQPLITKKRKLLPFVDRISITIFLPIIQFFKSPSWSSSSLKQNNKCTLEYCNNVHPLPSASNLGVSSECYTVMPNQKLQLLLTGLVTSLVCNQCILKFSTFVSFILIVFIISHEWHI